MKTCQNTIKWIVKIPLNQTINWKNNEHYLSITFLFVKLMAINISH